MRKLFLTFFYSGLSPKAPGTVGTLASLPLGLLILKYFGASTLALLTVFITLVAIKEIDKQEAITGIHDDESIVIDETAGIWLTLIIANQIPNFWFFIIASFLFFRIFDIIKPSVIGKIDRDVPGGLGVMSDDLVAGFFAGLSVWLSWSLLQKLIVLY
jgi:phosphatidylglycerophosphatase A